MSKNNIMNVLRGLLDDQLKEKIDETRQELFGLKLQKVTNPTKSNSQFKKLRKTIAQGLTVLRNNGMISNKLKGS